MSKNELSIKGNMMWNSVGSLISLVCQWLTTILVVRLSSGYDAAGALSLAMAISNVFAPIAWFSIRSYQVTDVQNKTTSREYVAFRLVTIVLAFCITLVYTLCTTELNVIPVVLVYLAYRTCDIFIDVLHGIDQRHMRMDFCGKSMAVRGVLSLVSFALVLAVSNSLLLSVLAMSVSVYPVIIYDLKNASLFEDVRPSITPKKCVELFMACLPAVVGTACNSAIITVARQMLGSQLGTTVLGIYASVCTPVVIIQSCARYVYAPLLGPLARKLDGGRYEAYLRSLLKIFAAFFLLAIVGLIGFKLFGALFLSLVFSQELAEYAYLFDFAVVSVVMCAFVSFLGDQLIAMRLTIAVFIGNVIGLLISATLSSYFISSFGMNGASLIIVLAYAVDSAFMFFYLLRRLKTLQHLNLCEGDARHGE